MSDKPTRITFFQTSIVIFFGWLGLAGFADNVVEWKSWFEYGIMEHWRAVKTFIISNYFYWLEFKVADFFIDYVMLGVPIARSLVHSFYQMKMSQKDPKPIFRKIIFHSIWITFLSIIMWPFIFFYIIFRIATHPILIFLASRFEVFSDRGKEHSIEYNILLSCLLIIIYTLITFIPLLFVVSDLSYSTGIIKIPY